MFISSIEECCLVMKEIMETTRRTFSPPVPLSLDASESETIRRQNAVDSMDEDMALNAEGRVVKKWETFISTCDESIRKKCKVDEPSNKFGRKSITCPCSKSVTSVRIINWT